MTITQTPLLGEENTPLHVAPGTGFESATPRHQVAFTPNPLATPLHTQDSSVSATPLRTPRDSLSLNTNTDTFSGMTPRDQRSRQNDVKRKLKQGFSALPKPENNFEVLAPEDEDDDQPQPQLPEEDAAERDARLRQIEEEEERKAVARQSQAVRLGLPRLVNVDMRPLLERLNTTEVDDDLAQAQRLINDELSRLILHDSIAHPLPGTLLPGGTQSAYTLPPDEDVDAAKQAIHQELAMMVGYPDVNPEQMHDGMIKILTADAVDDKDSWAVLRKRLTLDPSSKLWVEPTAIPLEQRLMGYHTLLSECRDLMTRDATKAAKMERKLTVTLGGYQARSQALIKRLTDAFTELQKAQVDFQSFSRLRINESAVGPRRVAALKEEVDKLERRERLLQEQYAELDTEKRDAEERVAALEEKVMAEAEALNEAHLAEMERT